MYAFWHFGIKYAGPIDICVCQMVFSSTAVFHVIEIPQDPSSTLIPIEKIFPTFPSSKHAIVIKTSCNVWHRCPDFSLPCNLCVKLKCRYYEFQRRDIDGKWFIRLVSIVFRAGQRFFKITFYRRAFVFYFYFYFYLFIYLFIYLFFWEFCSITFFILNIFARWLNR